MRSKIKDIYDEIYKNIDNYNYFDSLKNSIVDLFCQSYKGEVLDAGCGQGIHLKRLLACKVNAFGIELSEVCCNKYLKGFPHKNSDIVSFSKIDKQFEAIICMDVLEHIPPSDLSENLIALSRMLKREGAVLFFIANHSDKINGIELHLIQENENWWKEKLEKFFPYVTFLTSQFQGRGFYFLCCKEMTEETRIFLNLSNTFRGNVEMFETLSSNQTLLKESVENLKNQNSELHSLLKERESQLSSVKGECSKYRELTNHLKVELENKDIMLSELKEYSVQTMPRKKLIYHLAKKTIEHNPYLTKFIPRTISRCLQFFYHK